MSESEKTISVPTESGHEVEIREADAKRIPTGGSMVVNSETGTPIARVERGKDGSLTAHILHDMAPDALEMAAIHGAGCACDACTPSAPSAAANVLSDHASGGPCTCCARDVAHMGTAQMLAEQRAV